MIKGKAQFAPWLEDPDDEEDYLWADEDYADMRRRLRDHWNGLTRDGYVWNDAAGVWEEEKHPRDELGKWTSGGGSGPITEKEPKTIGNIHVAKQAHEVIPDVFTPHNPPTQAEQRILESGHKVTRAREGNPEFETARERFKRDLPLYDEHINQNTTYPFMATPKGIATFDLKNVYGADKPTVELNWLIAADRGAGRAALEIMIKAADKHGVTIQGYAVPLAAEAGIKMTVPRLEKFYEEFGFKTKGRRDPDGYKMIVRKPQPPQAAPFGAVEAPTVVTQKISSMRDYAEKSAGTLKERVVTMHRATGEVIDDYEQELELDIASLSNQLKQGSHFSNKDMFNEKGEYWPDNSILAMHTHPIDQTFSDGDWRVFMRQTIGEMKVVSHKNEYTLTKTPEFLAMPWQERTPAAVDKVYNQYMDEISDRILSHATKTKTDVPDSFVDDVIAETSIKVAKHFHINYEIRPIAHGEAAIIVRPKGWEAGSDEVATMTREGHAYRGMSEAEYKATVGAGKGIKSNLSSSIPSAEGTNFAEKAEDAESYANYGKDDPRKTGKPTYMVEIERGDNILSKSDGYLHAREEVPPEQITRVWKMEERDGAVIATEVKRGAPDAAQATSSPMTPAEIRTSINKVAADHNFPSDMIGTHEGDKTFELNGRTMYAAGIAFTGKDFDTEKNQTALSGPVFKTMIVVYNKFVSPKTIEGLVSHEIEHIKYQTAINRYQAEYTALMKEPGAASMHGPDAVMKPDGSLHPPYDEKYPAYSAMHEAFFSKNGIKEFAEADGVSEYSYEWWLNWKSKEGAGVEYFNAGQSAIHETLAEMARVKYETGKFPDHMGERIISWRGGIDAPSPTKAQMEKNAKLWRNLYRAVEKVWKSR